MTLPNDEILYTFPLPGSGVILSFMINILKGFLNLTEKLSPINVQRIVESFKYGYGRRTELGDTSFINVDDVGEATVP